MDNIKKVLEDGSTYIVLGGCGGIVAQLNSIRKGQTFRASLLVINMILGMWAGWSTGLLAPVDWGDTRLVVASSSGILSFTILDLLEQQGLNLIIKKYLGRK